MSQPGEQTIVVHILRNIVRSKDNKTMKLTQLIGYNMRNIFLEKSYKKYGGKASPRPFSAKIKFIIFLDQQFKISYKLKVIEIY